MRVVRWAQGIGLGYRWKGMVVILTSGARQLLLFVNADLLDAVGIPV
jgi:hypothetical protein